MTRVTDLTRCLEDALVHRDRLAFDVGRFQHAVWEAPDRERGHDSEWIVLEQLARRLAWFIPNEEFRKADPQFIGPDEAARRIEEGLTELARLHERS